MDLLVRCTRTLTALAVLTVIAGLGPAGSAHAAAAPTLGFADGVVAATADAERIPLTVEVSAYGRTAPVSATMTLPPRTAYVGTSTDRGGSCALQSRTVRCTLAPQPAQSTTHLTVYVRPTTVVPRPTVFVAPFTTSPVSNLPLTLQARTTLVPPGAVSTHLITTAVQASTAAGVVGQAVTVRASVGNDGPDTAHDVVLETTLPEQLAFVSMEASQRPSQFAGCGVAGRVVRCRLSSLDAGDGINFGINTRVAKVGAGSVDFRVSSREPDWDPSDNTRSNRVVMSDLAPTAARVTFVEDATMVGPTTVVARYAKIAGAPAWRDVDDVTVDYDLPSGASLVTAPEVVGVTDERCSAATSGRVSCLIPHIAADQDVRLLVRWRAAGGFRSQPHEQVAVRTARGDGELFSIVDHFHPPVVDLVDASPPTPVVPAPTPTAPAPPTPTSPVAAQPLTPAPRPVPPSPGDRCANLVGVQPSLPVRMAYVAVGRCQSPTARADVMWGDEGANIIDGGAGDDRLAGLAGNDRLIGGAGRDQLDAGAGDDLVEARDRAAGDRVACGAGRDTVHVDRGDVVARDCEVVVIWR